jgi:CheY-like chemotaxis protein
MANEQRDINPPDYQDQRKAGFITPEARILIVDDIATNLKVAEGLLSLYGVRIDTCTSGTQSIAMVTAGTYDLVFMDYMMSGMDGIETTAAIRGMGGHFQNLPIIALTANAAAGMRELFLEKGFSDYLTKPIELPKLDAIMAKWIPGEKKINHGAVKIKYENTSYPELSEKLRTAHFAPLTVMGVDVKKGIALTGGSDSAYRRVLSAFRKDALDRLVFLKESPEEASLPSFILQAHALKSAAAAIGAAGLAKAAMELESAGSAGDMGLIKDRLPGFRRDLHTLTEKIALALDIKIEPPTPGGGAETPAQYLPLFLELKTALEKGNIKTIDRILTDLEDKHFDGKIWEVLTAVSDAVLMTEFQEAIERLSTIC